MAGPFRRFQLGITVALLALVAIGWPSAQGQEPTLRLRLLSTTDIHTHIVDYDYYRDQPDISLGFARTATLIRQTRAEVRNSLLFDSGDLIQGNPLGDYVAVEQPLQPGQIHPVFKALNQLDYAAATLGNHEFNYGLGFLRATLAGANFPYVTSNVFVAGPDRAAAPPVIWPFVILGEHALSIGHRAPNATVSLPSPLASPCWGRRVEAGDCRPGLGWSTAFRPDRLVAAEGDCRAGPVGWGLG